MKNEEMDKRKRPETLGNKETFSAFSKPLVNTELSPYIDGKCLIKLNYATSLVSCRTAHFTINNGALSDRRVSLLFSAPKTAIERDNALLSTGNLSQKHGKPSQ